MYDIALGMACFLSTRIPRGHQRRGAMRVLRSCGPTHVPRGSCGALRCGSIPSGSDVAQLWRGSTRVLEEAGERVSSSVGRACELFACVVHDIALCMACFLSTRIPRGHQRRGSRGLAGPFRQVARVHAGPRILEEASERIWSPESRGSSVGCAW